MLLNEMRYNTNQLSSNEYLIENEAEKIYKVYLKDLEKYGPEVNEIYSVVFGDNQLLLEKNNISDQFFGMKKNIDDKEKIIKSKDQWGKGLKDYKMKYDPLSPESQNERMKMFKEQRARDKAKNRQDASDSAMNDMGKKEIEKEKQSASDSTMNDMGKKEVEKEMKADRQNASDAAMNDMGKKEISKTSILTKLKEMGGNISASLKGFLDKGVDFFKANPWSAVLAGAVAAGLTYAAFKKIMSIVKRKATEKQLAQAKLKLEANSKKKKVA